MYSQIKDTPETFLCILFTKAKAIKLSLTFEYVDETLNSKVAVRHNWRMNMVTFTFKWQLLSNLKWSELRLQLYASFSDHDGDGKGNGNGNGNEKGKKEIRVGLNVAKYHLGKVKFEKCSQRSPSSAARDLWAGLQGFCRILRFIALHVQCYQLIFEDQKLSYCESLRILAPSPPSLFCIWLPG